MATNLFAITDPAKAAALLTSAKSTLQKPEQAAIDALLGEKEKLSAFARDGKVQLVTVTGEDGKPVSSHLNIAELAAAMRQDKKLAEEGEALGARFAAAKKGAPQPMLPVAEEEAKKYREEKASPMVGFGLAAIAGVAGMLLGGGWIMGLVAAAAAYFGSTLTGLDKTVGSAIGLSGGPAGKSYEGTPGKPKTYEPQGHGLQEGPEIAGKQTLKLNKKVKIGSEKCTVCLVMDGPLPSAGAIDNRGIKGILFLNENNEFPRQPDKTLITLAADETLKSIKVADLADPARRATIESLADSYANTLNQAKSGASNKGKPTKQTVNISDYIYGPPEPTPQSKRSNSSPSP